MKRENRTNYSKMYKENAQDTPGEIVIESEGVETPEAEEILDDPATEEVVEEIIEDKVITGIVICPRLNVRKQPNTATDVICIVKKDDELTIHENESTDTFYKVVTPAGEEGYCMKAFISVK